MVTKQWQEPQFLSRIVIVVVMEKGEISWRSSNSMKYYQVCSSYSIMERSASCDGWQQRESPHPWFGTLEYCSEKRQSSGERVANWNSHSSWWSPQVNNLWFHINRIHSPENPYDIESNFDSLILVKQFSSRACVVVDDRLFVIGGQEGDFMAKPGSPIFKCSRRHEVYSHSSCSLLDYFQFGWL